MTAEKFGFQAEVSKLLNIVAHSLYSETEVFLRELISNASDACDKLRYEALTQPALTAGDGDLKITLSIDKKGKTLTVSDNGIGMNKEELVQNLGTIARSGTAAFLSQLSGDESKDRSLIGQFGVGFYSSFMVADKVEVLTRHAGQEEAWRWQSDGRGEFEVEAVDSDAAPSRGTQVIVHVKKSEKDFLEPLRVRNIVRRYSDHIGIPVVLLDDGKEDTLNEASALWTRPKSSVESDQYTEFYRHVSHGFDEPWLTLHWKAEGKIEYSALLFVPSARPFDLFQPERSNQVRLYVSRVFITDECEGLLPSWMRFLRGVVDSEDLPLNISREHLQNNPVLTKIRQGVIKRVLTELRKKAEKEPEAYATFWENFGPVLKEGIYEDSERRETLLGLARFRSSSGDGLVSLDDYIGRMKDGQDTIYTLSGEEADKLRASPQLEGFLSRGIEVLLLTDPVDEFWIPQVTAYKDKSFKSITRGGADLEKFEPEASADEKDEESAAGGKQLDVLIAHLKLALNDAVKDVRTTNRLTDSPVCLVADEGDIDMNLERLLKQHKRIDETAKRILEINPKHAVIRVMAKKAEATGASAELEDAAHILLDQARIMEGETVPDPAGFTRRLSGLLQRGLS